MGRGPECLVENGLMDELLQMGDVDVRVIEFESALPAEVSVAFELDRLIAQEVCGCRESGGFPLVLSGNCNNSVGTIAGTGCEELGIVWLDGHVDFNLPETTITGFSDNMGLSIAVGDCWNGMAAQVPGFSPVEKKNVVLVGPREIEPAERLRLDDSDIALFEASSLENAGGDARLGSALKALGKRTRAVYLHLDLDVLDPDQVGRANEFAPESGPTVEEVERIIYLTGKYCKIAAAGIASYDPALDKDKEVLGAGIRLARSLSLNGGG